MGGGPVGMLVVRAWVETGSAKPLRASIRLTHDTTVGFTEEVAVADVDAAVDVVRRWLEALLDEPATTD